jgi:uncharacterized GH25 family protein
MRTFIQIRAGLLVAGLAAALLPLAATNLAADTPDLITVTVVVTDATSGKPVIQAELTLTFSERGDSPLSRTETHSYTAKTDARGRGRFLYVPAGSVRLFVTHEHHAAFGKIFEVSKKHSTLEVKLKPPQPIL